MWMAVSLILKKTPRRTVGLVVKVLQHHLRMVMKVPNSIGVLDSGMFF
jgi:ABC-type branched-subunit amino acid transport system ATPase component